MSTRNKEPESKPSADGCELRASAGSADLDGLKSIAESMGALDCMPVWLREKIERGATKTIQANSMWLVVVECRYDVVRVSPTGNGFFIPGQEPEWALSHVSEWVREILPPNSETNIPSSLK